MAKLFGEDFAEFWRFHGNHGSCKRGYWGPLDDRIPSVNRTKPAYSRSTPSVEIGALANILATGASAGIMFAAVGAQSIDGFWR